MASQRFGRPFLAVAWATLLLVPTSLGHGVLDLSDQKWMLRNGAGNISVRGEVPSHVHLDLFAAKVISDPYLGLNDIDLRWVALSNWTYSSQIHGLHGLGRTNQSLHTYLLFDGLDTFASVSFCGQHVASTNNQFRQYHFDITSIVAGCQTPSGNASSLSSSANKTLEPELRIDFASAPQIAQAIASEPGQETWPDGVENVFEFPSRQFIRKEQSDFGWDWGPAFAPAGIWKKAWIYQLEPAHDEVVVTNVALDIHRVGQINNLPPDQTANWVLNASIDAIGGIPAGSRLRYHISEALGSSPGDVNTTVKHNMSSISGNLTAVNNTGDTITGLAIVPSGSVQLWWPNGMGEQALYNITLEVIAPSGRTIALTSRRTGFRTIVVNMEPVSSNDLSKGVQPGSNWHFEINGHPFYAKGSNFVPADAFWTRVTPERLRRILEAAVSGHQNMLRVWASGIYAPDALYDLADEMGVLLWSEFQFGDSLYPVDAEFLDNVQQEAIYQVRRTVHHPSLAVWAGGNELENLELYLVRNAAPAELPRYRDEYEQLFLGVLLPAVYGNSRGLTYMPSSTNNGYLYLNAPDSPYPWVPRYDNKTAGSMYGVTEWYNYRAPHAFDASIFPVGRFANEFGFHSMPSLATWREAITDDEDLSWDSQVVILRNHHNPPGGILDNDAALRRSLPGMAQMSDAVKFYYPAPNKRLNDSLDVPSSVANFSAWCHASQVFQADWLRHQIFFYRTGSGLPNRQLGALYWQLNDIWQASTWATVEYSGRWKVGHYITREAYQPVIAATVFNQSSGLLSVYAVSDLWSPVSGQVHLSWLSWSGAPLNVSLPDGKRWWMIGNDGAHGGNTTHGMDSKTNTVSLPVEIGPVNSTLVAVINVTQVVSEGGLEPQDGLLLATLTATGTPIEDTTAAGHQSPTRVANTTKQTRTYQHAVAYTPTTLAQARLVDPGLTLDYDEAEKVFEVQATKGISMWTWLDLTDKDAQSGLIIAFDDNGFLLRKGETRRLGYRVISGSGSNGWQARVTVQSIWNDTLPF